MFLKTAQFKKMLRELYTGGGVEVFNDGEMLWIGGSYWMITVKEGKINKENLASVIEFTGNLPEPGRGFCAMKDQRNQGSFKLQEISEGEIRDDLYISRIAFRYGNNVSMRLLQSGDREIYLLREDVLKLIDMSKLEPGEASPTGPLLMTDNSVEWRNDTMTLKAMLAKSDDFKEVVSALEGIPEGIV